MKKLIPILFLGVATTANAQVVINDTDFPDAGTTLTYGSDDAIADSLGVDLGTTGEEGQTFDFSMLVTDGLSEVSFYEPDSVQGGGDFPLADLAVDQIGGIFAFATVGASSVDIIGLAGDFAGQLGSPIPIVVSMPAVDPWTLFEFPASINSPILTDTAIFEGKFDSDGLIPSPYNIAWDPDSVHIKRTLYYTMEIDADGDLTDVLGVTHSVIRMSVVETSTDTIWGWTVANGWERPDSGIEAALGSATIDTVYRKRYVGQEVGYYVVDVTTDAAGTPISATFLSDASQCCTGIEEVIAAGGTVLYPNPTNGTVQVRTGGDIYQLEIMDMSGKLLQSTQLTVDGQVVQLDGLASGLYIYRMVEENGNVAHTGRLSYID